MIPGGTEINSLFSWFVIVIIIIGVVIFIAG